MGALKGNLNSIRDLKKVLRKMPITVAHDVAKRAAPVMTAQTRAAFKGGRSVYGDSRPKGEDGQALDLVETGAVALGLHFVSIGTVLRARLGPKYAKYLIGKYGILPNGDLPTRWARLLSEIVRNTKAPKP